MKSVYSLILLVITGCSIDRGQHDVMRYLDPALPVAERVDDLMNRMSLQQKLGQMNQYYAYGDQDSSAIHRGYADSARTLTLQGLVGSFLVIRNVQQANELQRLAEQSPLKIPLLLAMDGIHGHAYYPGTTVFPAPIGMAGTFNPDLIRRLAEVTAKEMRATGIHWNFSPYIDVCQDPRWGRVGENFGEDPLLVSRMGAAMVQGYQGNFSSPWNVLACPKVMLEGGRPMSGLNFAPLDVSERTIRSMYLPPFQACIDAGARTVMAGHNEVNGIPSHASRFLLTDILRGEMGFQGYVISDWHDIEALASVHHVATDQKDAVRQAVSAGVDVHMHGGNFIEPLEELVRDGVISTARIDEAVEQILADKFRLGLFEQRYVDETTAAGVLACPEHRELALQVARESLVLLKNEGGLLPLDRKVRRIFVAGPAAHSNAILGDWVVPQPPENFVTVLEGLREAVAPPATLDYFDCGGFTTIDDRHIWNAAAQARNADVAILVVGENENRYDEAGAWGRGRPDQSGGENIDRSEIELPGRQLELVQAVYNTGIPTVVVLVNGRPLAIEWIAAHIPAILETWQPGMEGGRAIAEALFGDINPGGKLPISVLRGAGHAPFYYNHKPSHLYLKYHFGETGPLYPFGYGLSYTSFRYQNLTVPAAVQADEAIPIAVEVQNTGQRSGDEVVQVFVTDLVSSVTTPVRELKAFTRVSLQPGETRRVELMIKPEQLGFYDREMRFVIEPGVFRVTAGDLAQEFELTGGNKQD